MLVAKFGARPLLTIRLLQQTARYWGRDLSLHEFARILLIYDRFPDPRGAETRLRVSCDGYDERRTHRDKPGVGPCSRRDRCRAATAGDCQWPDRRVGQRRSHPSATPIGGAGCEVRA